MNDPDGARIVITTEQSGNAFAPHYGDMIPLWVAGDTVPLQLSPGNVASSTAETLDHSPPCGTSSGRPPAWRRCPASAMLRTAAFVTERSAHDQGGRPGD